MNAPKLSSFLCAFAQPGRALDRCEWAAEDNRFSSMREKGVVQTGPAACTGLY